MRVMGLGNAVHWISWFIDSFSVMFVSCVLLTLILVVSSARVSVKHFLVSHNTFVLVIIQKSWEDAETYQIFYFNDTQNF